VTLAWIWLSRVPILLLSGLIALLVLVLVSIDHMGFTLATTLDRATSRLRQEAQ
jgi:hypothetical protein